MNIQKPDKKLGYILLIIGIIIVLIPVIISILILAGAMPLPQFIQKPQVSGGDPNLELARVLAETIPIYNIIPVFLLFVVMIYGASVLMGKGVGLVKEIKWKITKATKEDVEEKTEETYPKRTKKSGKQPEEE